MTKVFSRLVNSEPTHVLASNYEQINRKGNQNVNMVKLFLDVYANAPTFEFDGLSNRSAETDAIQHNPRHPGQYAIMGSRQTFLNASAFQDALYLISLGVRFRYYYKRNTSKHIYCLYGK